MSLRISFNESLLAINSLFFFVWQCPILLLFLKYNCTGYTVVSQPKRSLSTWNVSSATWSFPACWHFSHPWGTVIPLKVVFFSLASLTIAFCLTVFCSRPTKYGCGLKRLFPPQDSLYILRMEVHIVIGSGKCSATPPSRTVSPPGHPSTCGVLSTCLNPPVVPVFLPC